MSSQLGKWVSAVAVVGVLGGMPVSGQDEARRTPVVLEGRTTLSLRVLARPFSNIYKDAAEDSAIVQENVPAFQPLYVYTQPPASDLENTGWYEVGSDNRGTVLGWMHARDVMEWKQAMCLAYTHPQGRKPVLMFQSEEPLKKAILASAAEREELANGWYNTIDSGAIPAAFPVISMEPKRAVHILIEEQFYLLPILDFEAVEMDGREGRLLKMAAATSSKAGRGETKLSDKEFRDQATTETDAKDKNLGKLKVQVVYAIDLTTSMQPYVDATLAAVKAVAESIGADADLAGNVQFGLWGYRDSDTIKGIEFNTRNFTPALQTAADFVQTLAGVKAATVGSAGFDEDVFSGIDKSLRETAWDDDALRFVILIGDAPSHEAGHKWNQSGQSEETLRQYADENMVKLYAVHIVSDDPKVGPFNERAERQFRVLARNPGIAAEGGSYSAMPANDPAAFQSLSEKLVTLFKSTVAGARKNSDVSAVMAAAEGEAPSDFAAEGGAEAAAPTTEEGRTQVAEAEQKAADMVRAALVEWLGKEGEVQSPRDITAWVVDKDLLDPAVPSLDVRVLVTKNQLDSLRTVLQEVMVAGRQGQTSGEDFFEALLSTSATMSVTPEQIRQATSLGESGYVPEFLKDLPYKSQIMSMNNDVWNGWSQDQQDEFLNSVDAKINLYAATHDNPDGWIRLNAGDDPDEFVHPIALDMLP